MSHAPFTAAVAAAVIVAGMGGAAPASVAAAAPGSAPVAAASKPKTKAAPKVTLTNPQRQVIFPGERVTGIFSTKGLPAGTKITLQEKIGTRWVTRVSGKTNRSGRVTLRYLVRSIPTVRSASFRGATTVKGKTYTSRAVNVLLMDPVRNLPPVPENPAPTPEPSTPTENRTLQLRDLDHLFHTGQGTHTIAQRYGKYVDNGWSVLLLAFDGATDSGLDTFRTSGCTDFQAIARSDEGTDGSRVTIEILKDNQVAWSRELSPYTEEPVSLSLAGSNSISFRATTTAPVEGTSSLSADIIDPTFTCR